MSKTQTSPATHVDRFFDFAGNGCTIHANAFLCSAHLMSRYLSGDYTGALFDPPFESLPWQNPNRILRTDLFIVASLSMSSFARISFLSKVGPIFDGDAKASDNCSTSSCTAHIGCMLNQISVEASIFDSTTSAMNLRIATDLWYLIEKEPTLKSTEKFGVAGLSKLLAQKRPALLPILDKVALARIRNSGERHRGEYNWYFLARELQSSVLVEEGVSRIRTEVNVPAHLTDLRIVDIAVWMRQNLAGRLLDDRQTCQPL